MKQTFLRLSCWTLFSVAPLSFTWSQEENGEKDTAEEEKAEELVSIFEDKGLEDAVRKQVFEKRNSEVPLIAEDVRTISTVHADGVEISSLKGLEHCSALAELRLSNQKITDLSPLKNLEKLQSLDLSNNQIVDLGPLAKLERLQYLNLEHNQVSDLSPLVGLVKLNSLYLTDNKITNLTPLEGMEKLWSLYLGKNAVENLDVIPKLGWLKSLGLEGNGLKDLSALMPLPELTFLDLRNNELTDLSPLVEACKKDAEGDKRFAPFLRLYLEGNEGLADNAKDDLDALKEIGVRVEM